MSTQAGGHLLVLPIIFGRLEVTDQDITDCQKPHIRILSDIHCAIGSINGLESFALEYSDLDGAIAWFDHLAAPPV